MEWERSPRAELELEEAHEEYRELLLQLFKLKPAEELSHFTGSHPPITGITVFRKRAARVGKPTHSKLEDAFPTLELQHPFCPAPTNEAEEPLSIVDDWAGHGCGRPSSATVTRTTSLL